MSRYLEVIPVSLRQIADSNWTLTDIAWPIMSPKKQLSDILEHTPEIRGVHVNRKWGFFFFSIPWRQQIFTAKFLFRYTDNLPQNLGKNIVQERRKSTSGWHALLQCLCQSSLKRYWNTRLRSVWLMNGRFGQFWLSIAISHWPENRRANGS